MDQRPGFVFSRFYTFEDCTHAAVTTLPAFGDNSRLDFSGQPFN